MFFKLISLTLTLLSCEYKENKAIGAVVSAREEASKIGVDIMARGGNAFDAMIATDLALSVCYPNAGNIAGGGFFIYRKSTGELGSLDYREKAPKKAHKDLFLDDKGNVIPNKSTLGGLAIGVPGTIAGLYEIHEKMGSLPWKELIQPAIDLAENGYVVTSKQFKSFQEKRSDFIKVNGINTLYGTPFKVGDTVKNKSLATTLKLIQKNGKDGFYTGVVANSIVDKVKNTGGIISLEDLKEYSPIWRELLNFKYKDLNIYSMALPSSGGVCLAQILKMIEPYPINEYGHNSIKSIQVIVEAERRSYADRSKFLGDPDFVDVPVKELISEIYLKSKMDDFSFNKASKSKDINPGKIIWNESEETTHYSIIDPMGNAVAVTTTLNGSYGSKVFVEEGGFFLNNEMDDFSSKPGVPNMFGLVGSNANSIEPEKRMLSSMTPTIVEKNGKLSLILGTPGGATIITSVLQIILNVYEFNMDIQTAVNSPRFHHQWLPDMVVFEPEMFKKGIKKLIDKGYNIEKKNSRIIGRVDAIYIDNNNISTGADPRGDDYSAILY